MAATRLHAVAVLPKKRPHKTVLLPKAFFSLLGNPCKWGDWLLHPHPLPAAWSRMTIGQLAGTRSSSWEDPFKKKLVTAAYEHHQLRQGAQTLSAPQIQQQYPPPSLRSGSTAFLVHVPVRLLLVQVNGLVKSTIGVHLSPTYKPLLLGFRFPMLD